MQGEIVLLTKSAIFDGFTTVPNSILRSPDISPGAKNVFFLCLRYERTKVNFNLRQQLAMDLGEGTDQISQYLCELADVDLITLSSNREREELISINIQ
ncbi:MAG: hypothetical protein KJP25_00225 [Gammaproteobacteria bacterium]|nr:hypothetical protein [Gammaproteobacteria bacterium]NND38634.1 hypothetical protein [Pseudomonadales bacterium]RZV53126.1 MAG: hypothetical protein EX270_09010 [Pseudomonadales bacterium]